MHKELKKCLTEKHKDKDKLKTKIEFFQHERLVHLIVTFFVGISAINLLIGFIITENIGLGILYYYLFLIFFIITI